MRHRLAFPPRRPQLPPEPPGPPSRRARLRARLASFHVRFRGVLLVAAGIVIALGSVALYDAVRAKPQRITQRDIDRAVEHSLANMPPAPSRASLAYESIRSSVVRVRSTVARGSRAEGNVGTGVIIDNRGTVLTSLHIVQGATRIQVTFFDGTESDADVAAQQPENDLAVLRPRTIPDNVQPATLAPGSVLNVGDEVFAVGHPFGIANSLSAGVVSGLGRTFRTAKSAQTLRNLIQIDAAINPGNSGGPLLNRDGEVVGIITGLLNPTEQEVFIGIGFAVPIQTAAAAAGSPPY